MTIRILAAPIIAVALMFGGAAWSQDDNAQAEDSATPELALGEEVGTEDGIGSTYVAEVHGKWESRCLRTESGNDPCRLYQLLFDDEQNSVAEISVFSLPDGQEAAAGATIATPLDTLLMRQLTLAVDGANSKRYPFSHCNVQGCYSRVGFTAEDLDRLRKGATASLTIVPVAAPDSPVTVQISLAGFTAGFAAIQAANRAAAADQQSE